MTTIRDNDVEELGKCKRTVTIRDVVFISYGKIIERNVFSWECWITLKNKSVLRMRTSGKYGIKHHICM